MTWEFVFWLFVSPILNLLHNFDQQSNLYISCLCFILLELQYMKWYLQILQQLLSCSFLYLCLFLPRSLGYNLSQASDVSGSQLIPARPPSPTSFVLFCPSLPPLHLHLACLTLPLCSPCLTLFSLLRLQTEFIGTTGDHQQKLQSTMHASKHSHAQTDVGGWGERRSGSGRWSLSQLNEHSLCPFSLPSQCLYEKKASEKVSGSDVRTWN